jgi:hypothetical protein
VIDICIVFGPKVLRTFLYMIWRRILRLQPLNSCKTRSLSDKPRNRKWDLPSIMYQSSVSNIPTTNRSRTTKRAANGRFPTACSRALSSDGSKSSPRRSKLESWAVQKLALKQKYPEGYHPFRKVSPDAIEGIRILHRQVQAFVHLRR